MGVQASGSMNEISLSTQWQWQAQCGCNICLNPAKEMNQFGMLMKSYTNAPPPHFKYAFTDQEWAELYSDWKRKTDPENPDNAAFEAEARNLLVQSNCGMGLAILIIGIPCCLMWSTSCCGPSNERKVSQLSEEFMQPFHNKWAPRFREKGFTYEPNVTQMSTIHKQTRKQMNQGCDCQGDEEGRVQNSDHYATLHLGFVASIDEKVKQSRYPNAQQFTPEQLQQLYGGMGQMGGMQGMMAGMMAGQMGGMQAQVGAMHAGQMSGMQAQIGAMHGGQMGGMQATAAPSYAQATGTGTQTAPIYTPPSAPAKSGADRLLEVKKLHDQGLIDDEEYKVQKAKILQSM